MSAMQPFFDRIQQLRQMGGQAVDAIGSPMRHLVQGAESVLGLNKPIDAHQQSLDEMNRNLNAHRNDAANQSFVHPDVTTMKKPLGK